MIHVFVLHQIVVFALLDDFHVNIILAPLVKVADFVHRELRIVGPVSFKIGCQLIQIKAIGITKTHRIYHTFSQKVDGVLLCLFADLDSQNFLENVLHCALVAEKHMAVLVLVKNNAVLMIFTCDLNFFVESLNRDLFCAR